MDQLAESKDELSEFIGTIKDTGPVLHTNPRFLHHEQNFDMEFYGQKDYIHMHWSALDLVPGNDFKWDEQPSIKMGMEFDNVWLTTTIYAPYVKEKFIPLIRFIEENGLEIFVPEEEVVEEDVTTLVTAALGGKGRVKRQKIQYFQVGGLALYDMDMVKRFIMTFDEQMTVYHYEEPA